MTNEEQFDCSFEIFANEAVWGNIEGDIENQTDLKNALDAKADVETVNGIDERLGEVESDYVPNTRTVNGKALSSNITLDYSDVGALSSSTTINDLTTTAQQNALNSGATTTNIGQITTNQNNIAAINEKIPAQASSSNQLADKNFVNSSIATNTANFIGTFEDVTSLEAYSGTVTNNDYAFVINSVVTDNGNDWTDFATLDAADKSKLTNFDYAWVVNGANFDLYRFDIVEQEWSLRVQNTAKADVTLNTAYNRYKATEVSNVITWAYEYTLNNSSFTANQWAAINSGATTTNIALIGTINTTISGYGNIVTHNTSEFATAAQGAKADTALQNLATGGTQAIALGTLASATASGSIAYGYSAGATSTYSMAIGWDAGATNTNTIAIGKGAKATASGAIAIGTGAENSTANTFQVKTYELLDLSTGLIPDARISSNIARTTDVATIDLNNLSETGNDRLHALKGYKDEGKTLTDTELYNDVYFYAHSTYNSNPFTTYGNPTITNGVASGFSSSDGVYFPVFTPSTYSWEIGIEQEVTAEAIADSNNSFVFFTDNADKGINIQSSYSNASYDSFTVSLKFTDGTVTSNSMSCNTSNLGISKCVAGDKQRFKLGYDGIDTYYFMAFKNGVLCASSTYTTSTSQVVGATTGYNYNTIGFRRGNRGTKNKIDLKTFYEKINGVLTLSGNLTGIDTIKPDNYTIVGSPTISNEGIASGFSSSNYLTTPTIDLSTADNWKIKIKTDYIPEGTSDKFIIGNKSASAQKILLGRLNTTGNLYFRAFAADETQIASVYTGMGANLSGYVEFGFTGTQYFITRTLSDGTTNTSTTDSTTKTGQNGALYIGYDFNGTIDLNSIEVYVDGNLIYQPCLKIPYTLSKTGSKVVDNAYYNRVLDTYNQFGSANYYTIDETNKNATLPMGEIYGMMNILPRIKGYDGTTTQTLKNVNGVFTWVTDTP